VVIDGAGAGPVFAPGRARSIPAAREKVGGVLLLHYENLEWAHLTAANVVEHVSSFKRYSRFPVFTMNTDLPLPEKVAKSEFAAIVLHYSLFAPRHYHLDEGYRELLQASAAYKIAFFQDEHRYCQDRFRFCDLFGIDCVYTCLEPSEYDKVWRKYTSVPELKTTLPSYVDDERLVGAAKRFARPDAERAVDVGYRGRPLAAYMGRSAIEKTEVGRGFAERAAGTGLELDIGLEEEDRLYGDDYYRFLGNAKAILGVESGISVYDVEDRVLADYERLLAAKGEVTVADLQAGPLGEIEDRIYYRTIAPRNFEAAAFRTGQVLFEGRYSGLMEPMVHYIPLRTDFSNFDEVVERVSDPSLRAELTERAYADLIASGRFNYESFIASFDRGLIEAGVDAAPSGAAPKRVSRAIVRARRVEPWRRRGQRAREAARYRTAVIGNGIYRLLDATPPGRALLRALRRLAGRSPAV
jgi:hypothetical protein